MSTSPPASTSLPPATLEATLGSALRLLFALGCVFYAVLAFDYFIAFASGREGLWLRLFSALVGPARALGAGSVHVDQQVPYTTGLNFMLMHTTTGAIAMALGPFQFSVAFRRRFTALHRQAGKVYLSMVVLSMFAGLAYLAVTPLAAVFSGAPFAVALIGLDGMVLLTAWLAYAAIRQREIERHRAWMAFNFGLLLATPGLRLLWILFGWMFPGLNQAETNLGIMTFLLPLCVSFMLLWLAAQPARAAVVRGATGHGAQTPFWRQGPWLMAAAGSLFVTLHGVLRFLLPADPLAGWLSPEQLARDAAVFWRVWPLATLTTAAVVAAMCTGVAALRCALESGQTSRPFLISASLAAMLGAVLAARSGGDIPGGATMQFFWFGLAALWLLALLRSGLAARAGRGHADSRSTRPGQAAAASIVVRDWTAYAVGLAFLPLTLLPGAWLWSALGVMTFDQAVVTAATLSFAAHYLLAHLWIYGLRARRPAALSAG